ncbi:MAG: nucleolar RNA-binding Nop10p family protein [Candidatus Micrarchaeota archaeon]
MKRMRRCEACGSYTLLGSHCSRPTVSAHPARFNPNDPFARQRRESKGIGF